jgi:peptide/nickel transport system ATP-binding protein
MGVRANFSERIAVLYAGKLIEEADTRTIFRYAAHPYTQHLIRSLPKLDDKSDRLSIPGRPTALDNLPTGCCFHPRCPYGMDICRSEVPPWSRSKIITEPPVFFYRATGSLDR